MFRYLFAKRNRIRAGIEKKRDSNEEISTCRRNVHKLKKRLIWTQKHKTSPHRQPKRPTKQDPRSLFCNQAHKSQRVEGAGIREARPKNNGLVPILFNSL